VAAARWAHRPVHAEVPVAGRLAALSRDRIAGRSNRPGFCGPSRRERRHLACQRRREKQFRRLGFTRAPRLHVVTTRLSRPHVCGERQRHPHRVRFATGKEIYKARAGGSGNTFSASPWARMEKSICSARTATLS
jgi:hypothetical protein